MNFVLIVEKGRNSNNIHFILTVFIIYRKLVHKS